MRMPGERLVYDGPEVRVCQVDLGLADGDVLPWDVVRLGRSASVVLADDLGQVLLVRRYRAGLGRWGWELPGGLVQDGEPDVETAARELAEQAGYMAGELSLVVSFQPEPCSVQAEHVIFAGQDPEPVTGAGWCGDDLRARWLAAESVPQLIGAGQIWAAATLIGLLGAQLASGRP